MLIPKSKFQNSKTKINKIATVLGSTISCLGIAVGRCGFAVKLQIEAETVREGKWFAAMRMLG